MSTLLLTGATGSFGKAFVQDALARRTFSRIIAFSDTESNQSAMKRSLPPSDRLEYFIGNVRDIDRLRWAFRAGVDVVIHAAAMKEVPTCEYDWPEAVATNVDGSRNVALAAIEAGVPKALLISTDKSCEAVTAYGKTKAMAEEWFIRSNVRARGTQLAVVRYGNVLSSRASVVPAFRARAAANEPLPLTDIRMTRFWWTLAAAVAFVYQALGQMDAGHVWVPKLRAASMLTLAQALSDHEIPRSSFELVGIRGVEKLHEVLIAADEGRHVVELPTAFVVMPAGVSWKTSVPAGAVPVAAGFRYSSDDASRWLSVDEMRTMIGLAEDVAC